MAKIIINKNYFKNLSKGMHTLRVNFKDGHAEGPFEVNDKITFSILGKTFTATAGMTWRDWILSYGQGASTNSVVILQAVSSIYDPKVYIDYRHDTSWDIGCGVMAAEDELFNELDVPQYGSTVIAAGANYGRSSDVPT